METTTDPILKRLLSGHYEVNLTYPAKVKHSMQLCLRRATLAVRVLPNITLQAVVGNPTTSRLKSLMDFLDTAESVLNAQEWPFIGKPDGRGRGCQRSLTIKKIELHVAQSNLLVCKNMPDELDKYLRAVEEAM